MCGKGPSLQGFGGQKRIGVIPNSRFLNWGGQVHPRPLCALLGRRRVVGHWPGALLVLRRQAGSWAAHYRRSCPFPVRVAGVVVAGVAFQRTGTRAGPGRGPTVRDSKDRQVPRLDLGLD